MPTRVGAKGGQSRARGLGELAALHTRSGRGEPGPRPGPGQWPRAALGGVWTSGQGSGSHPRIQWAPLKGSPGAASSPFINHPSLETKSSLSGGQELRTHGPASHPHALDGEPPAPAASWQSPGPPLKNPKPLRATPRTPPAHSLLLWGSGSFLQSGSPGPEAPGRTMEASP